MVIKQIINHTDDGFFLTIKEFETILTNSKGTEETKINSMLNKYSSEESMQIKEIYNEIIEFLKK